MNEDARLTQVADSLARVGVRFLVMGGHAARHYGVMRHTIDVDLHVSADSPQDLVNRLGRSGLFGECTPVEGPSWRPADFRRFRPGRLPDGREEWLDLWLRNHLLGPFEAMYKRRETSDVQGICVPFMGLPDLLHSKETERQDDWLDVALLIPLVHERCPPPAEGIPDFILGHLCRVEPGSSRHLALVEAVRRIYRQNAMAADRADKLRIVS